MNKNFVKNFLSIILVIVLFFVFWHFYEEKVKYLFREFQEKINPCKNPITYSITSIDPRFSLTKEELLDAVKKAEKIWEASAGRELFEYSPTGYLKLSLVYDYRQEATDALKKIGIIINSDQANFDNLKEKYDSLIDLYNKEKEKLEIMIESYNSQKSILENDINIWNSHAGNKAPKSEYNLLEKRMADLNNKAEVINQAQNSLNELVGTIKSTELILNKLIYTLGLQVDSYNNIVASTGKEFNEGEYVKNINGTEINIFQFSDKNQLLRVLAHEFGHALGLDHINNQNSIMYYLNESGNQEITADDEKALKTTCKIE